MGRAVWTKLANCAPQSFNLSPRSPRAVSFRLASLVNGRRGEKGKKFVPLSLEGNFTLTGLNGN